jgi:hypothetical protein
MWFYFKFISTKLKCTKINRWQIVMMISQNYFEKLAEENGDEIKMLAAGMLK